MIQKISPRIIPVKPALRSSLQKASAVGLTVLAGCSMSGAHIRPSVTKDMVIPGGLTFNEELYFVATGEFPPTVKRRLVDLDSNYVMQPEDEVINLTMRGEHIEFYNNKPHSIDEISDKDISESSQDIDLADFAVNNPETLGGSYLSETPSILDSIDDNNEVDLTDYSDAPSSNGGDMSLFDIWLHLSGLS